MGCFLLLVLIAFLFSPVVAFWVFIAWLLACIFSS